MSSREDRELRGSDGKTLDVAEMLSARLATLINLAPDEVPFHGVSLPSHPCTLALDGDAMRKQLDRVKI